MAITSVKFTPRAVPNEVAPSVRAYLDDQLRRLGELVNTATLREDDETIAGDWEFTGSLVVPQATITAHESALTIAETQITDGALLARVAAAETITGGWIFTHAAGIRVGTAASKAQLTDDGSVFMLQAASVTGVAAISAAPTQALTMRAMSLNDDATGTFTLPTGRNGGLLFITATNTANVMTGEWAMLYVDDNISITDIQLSNAAHWDTGDGSNNDTDGAINVWSATSGIVSVKNRRGTSRRIQLVLMG